MILLIKEIRSAINILVNLPQNTDINNEGNCTWYFLYSTLNKYQTNPSSNASIRAGLPQHPSNKHHGNIRSLHFTFSCFIFWNFILASLGHNPDLSLGGHSFFIWTWTMDWWLKAKKKKKRRSPGWVMSTQHIFGAHCICTTTFIYYW